MHRPFDSVDPTTGGITDPTDSDLVVAPTTSGARQPGLDRVGFAVPRFVFALVPAIVIVSVGVSVVWGESGLLTRRALQHEVVEANDALAALERENQRLVRELQIMDEDPLVLERLVAEELGWGKADATIIRFTEEEQTLWWAGETRR